mgnify:CR=1 FL=1
METQRLHDFLDQSPWIKGLTPAQVDRVHQDTLVRRYQAGDTVCVRGTPSAYWVGVIEGMLKVENSSPGGKSATLTGVPAGAWIGEGAVIKGELRPYDLRRSAIRNFCISSLPSNGGLQL